MSEPEASIVAEWLLQTSAGKLEPEAFVSALAERLNHDGFAICRVSAWIPTLHPELWGNQLLWDPDNQCRVVRRDHDVTSTPDYIGTPGEVIHRDRVASLRCRLDAPREQIPFAILRQLAEEGATDYFILSLDPGGDRPPWVAFATDRSGGFEATKVERLLALGPLLSLHFQLARASFATRSLLEVYLGANAASRVLAGQFRRGTGVERRALRGRTTTFELPRGRLLWSYTMAGTPFSGEADLTMGLPRMLRCGTTQAGLRGDTASCEPAPAPETPPPDDASAALAGSVLGFLEQLARDVEREDLTALGASIEPPLDVEWEGESPGSRRVKHARHLLEVREHLGLDPKVLAAAKARTADLRTGEADCVKHEIDWSKGGPALTCDGRDVSVTLSAGPDCGNIRQMSTWKLRNASHGWQLVGKCVTVVR